MLNSKKLMRTITSLFAALFIFVCPAFAETTTSDRVERLTLEQAQALIKTYYVNDVSDSVLNQSNISDIVKGLNDPYSAYFLPDQYNNFVNEINNKITGIGVQIDVVPEGAKVVSVIDGSSALSTGIKAGDIIVDAGGHSLAGKSSEEMVSYIRGQAGTSVEITVKRGQDTLKFSVVRKDIVMPTVTGKIMDNHIGYIDISSFGDKTGEEFSSKLNEIKSKNPDCYIIDLRYNGGGYLDTSLDIAGHFIGGGNTALKIQAKNQPVQNKLAVDHGAVIDKPIIFLVNKYTASASEILSGAVKDYKKAYFIGETTYGKGVAQSMFQLYDGSYLKITTERFYSPLGNVIQKVGISPDLAIKNEDINYLTAAEILLGEDPSGTDKTGFIKTYINGRTFYIDTNSAKTSEYLSTFKYMLDNVIPSDNLYVGTKEGWQKASNVQSLKNTLFPKAASNASSSASASSASQKLLPKTGSMVDEKFLIVVGIIIMAGGFVIYNSSDHENRKAS